MTTSLWILIGFLLLFWASAYRLTKSPFPVVPVAPVLLLLGGVLLNRWIDWLGTIAVVLVHAVPMAVIVIANRRELFSAKRD
jgi:hypothetical protein